MPDASPAKWHLGHTTWFFETFVLQAAVPGYRAFHPDFAVLFNSYYNTVGEQHPRPRRGMLTRPPLEEIRRYRGHVDGPMHDLLASGRLDGRMEEVVTLGLNHEQQHQELILTDIKHMLSCNPLGPAYLPRDERPPAKAGPLDWHAVEGGLRRVGHDGEGFAFDNESPRHRVHLEAFDIAARPVTCGEYLAFIQDGGYRRPEFWLSDGWDTVRREAWSAPLYWEGGGSSPVLFTLSGPREVDLDEPVTHVSYYEADAYARWAGFRLPTEAEWETAAAEADIEGNFAESGLLHPAAAARPRPARLAQMFGDVWEWTASAYSPYPGYRPPAGALGEYNGKFMCNQMVLRGGSCATPRSHIRRTYRNFFYPGQRWQFTGIRLARDSR